MRLIDADKLLDRLPKVDLDHDEKITRSGAIMDMICMVETAPTVEVPRWIPVTERLPENTADVLVFRPKMKIEIGISCRINDEWLRYGKDLHGNDVITHWMPLPEPPEVE